MNANDIENIEYELKKQKTFDYMQPYASLCDLCVFYYKNRGGLFWKKKYSAHCTTYLKQFELTSNQMMALVYESLVGFSELAPDKLNESVYTSQNYPFGAAIEFHTAMCLCISCISQITKYDIKRYLSQLLSLYRENSPSFLFPYFTLRSIFIYAINDDPHFCEDLFRKERKMMADFEYDEYVDITIFYDVVKVLIENGNTVLAKEIADYCVWKAQNAYSLKDDVITQFTVLW